MMTKNNIIWVFLILLFLVPANLESKDFNELTFRERLFFGGHFGLMIGTITNIELSPIVGYRFTPRLSLALGPKYQYYKEGIFINTHIYGGRAFARYMLIKDLNNLVPLNLNAGLFFHTEYEGLSLEEKYFGSPGYEGRFLLNSVLVGGGVSQPVGDRGALNITVLWNINGTDNTPYTNPVIRIGFNF
ncbi:MAG: hypothetical protein GH151_11815 [Bacteroidetes bacterium]|nr:hypothetical protein [Bacteroidota bacterium]